VNTNNTGKTTRRRLCATSVLVALALTLAACGDGGDAVAPGTAGEGNGGSLKVGLVAPYSGVFGFYGPTLEAAMQAGFKAEAAAGQQVELLTEDDQTDPQTALSKVRKLVQQDEVQAVVCCVNGAATLAVAPYLSSVGVAQIAPLPGPAGLEKFKTAWSVGFYPQQLTEPFGRYAYEELGHRTATILSSDFVQGRLVADGFKKGFTEAGGEIVKEIYPPLDNADYGPFLSQIGDPDIVFGFLGGADAVRVVKQYKALGVDQRTQLIGLGPLVTRLILDQQGEDAVGVQGMFHYPESGLDNQSDEDFLAAIKGAPPKITPNFVQANAYATAKVLLAAGKEASSGKEFAAAVGEVSVDAPWGQLKFDPKTHYPVLNGYFYEVVQGADRLEHKVLGTFEGQR
jgi:branched-chain amino acid transport system substrate-binding protein